MVGMRIMLLMVEMRIMMMLVMRVKKSDVDDHDDETFSRKMTGKESRLAA